MTGAAPHEAERDASSVKGSVGGDRHADDSKPAAAAKPAPTPADLSWGIPPNPDAIGRLVRLEDGLVFIDLDGALEDDGSTVPPWGQEFLELHTYTEISPSGKGLRLVVRDSIPGDIGWNSTGVEMYGGHAPRFVTITGRVL